MNKLLAVALLLLINISNGFSESTPRPEYPRPQFERSEWINLNGTWTFQFDFGNSGKDRQLQSAEKFSKNITVPFCPESKLSGVEYTDFINQMWYQRKISIPTDWKERKFFCTSELWTIKPKYLSMANSSDDTSEEVLHFVWI